MRTKHRKLFHLNIFYVKKQSKLTKDKKEIAQVGAIKDASHPF